MILYLPLFLAFATGAAGLSSFVVIILSASGLASDGKIISRFFVVFTALTSGVVSDFFATFFNGIMTG